MKRRVLQIIVLLVLGAIVNVAVAWGIVEFVAPYSSPWAEGLMGTPRKIPPFVGLTHKSHANSRGTWDVESGYRAFGFDIYLLRTLHGGIGNHFQSHSMVVGWPAQSVWSRHVYTSKVVDGNPPIYEEEVTGILVGDLWLPCTVIWPGFAINTIFYAAMLGVVFFVPGMVKRRVRRRRGLCPACAYPVGTSPVCTECGASLPLPSGGEGEGRGEGA